MGRATTYGIWSVFLYLVVTWLTVQGYIHLRMNMIPYPCTEQREGGGPWIGRESQVLFIFVNKWVMYFWWSSIRGGGGGGGAWTSQSIGPVDSGYYYVIKRKVCSSLNGELLTDNCQCKKSADQHNIENCGLSCAACMYACKRFDAWHPFDSQLTDVKERNPLTRRTLSIAISRVKHIKDKCLFWKVDSWPVKSSPLNRGLKFYFWRRGMYWLGAHYISQADILFCSSI